MSDQNFNSGYGEPPYRRTVWTLHRNEGRLMLEEYVLAADEKTGEYSIVVRHTLTPVDEMDYPSPAKFHEVGKALQDGASVELNPASEYWDEDDYADEPDEAEVAQRAAEIVAERVIPVLDKAVQRAARELASEGYDFNWRVAAEYVLTALARFLTQDVGIESYAVAPLDSLNTEAALHWYAENLPDPEG